MWGFSIALSAIHYIPGLNSVFSHMKFFLTFGRKMWPPIQRYSRLKNRMDIWTCTVNLYIWQNWMYHLHNCVIKLYHYWYLIFIYYHIETFSEEKNVNIYPGCWMILYCCYGYHYYELWLYLFSFQETGQYCSCKYMLSICTKRICTWLDLQIENNLRS